MFDLTTSNCVNNNYKRFFDKYGYIPKFFSPYDRKEFTDYCYAITTHTGMPGSYGCVLILEDEDND